MTWTVWDVLITVLGVLHIAFIVGIIAVIRRIFRGPVAKTAGRAGAVAEKGRVAAEGALNALNANRAHVESIVRDVQGIGASLRTPAAAGDLPINYRSLRNSLATLAMVRKGLGAFRKRGETPAPGPSAAKTAPARPSLPERLGLVPPAARHVLRFLPYLRIVRTVLQQMKGR